MGVATYKIVFVSCGSRGVAYITKCKSPAHAVRVFGDIYDADCVIVNMSQFRGVVPSEAECHNSDGVK
jgi:hypothetical protein